MQENFKYTDEFFKEYEEKYIPKPKEQKIKPQQTPKKKHNFLILLCPILIIVLLLFLIVPKGKNGELLLETNQNLNFPQPITQEKLSPYKEPTEQTVILSDDINSEFAILINADTGEIIAQKNCNEKMYPASLTKIMTLLVAVENIKDINDTYEMSYLIIDPVYKQGASLAGFSSGETVKIIDLLYGIILPSGADATCAIADYISGSEEAFVALMNKKAEDLGLKNTRFANSSGLHDENNYTTVYDMALILTATLENDLAKQILSAFQYTTATTEQHPNGVWMDSTLSHYIDGDEPENKTRILGGKTGYVSQSGNCIASFAKSVTGNNYIFVSGKAESGRKAAKDHITVYSAFAN